MKLILFEDIKKMKDIPLSINQVQMMLNQHKVRFRPLLVEVIYAINQLLDTFVIEGADNRELRNIITRLSHILEQSDDTIFEDYISDIQESLTEILNVLDNYSGLGLDDEYVYYEDSVESEDEEDEEESSETPDETPEEETPAIDSEKLNKIKELSKSKDLYERNKSKISRRRREYFENAFEKVDKCIADSNPDLMTAGELETLEDAIDELTITSTGKSIDEIRNDYDKRFEEANSGDQRRDIISQFFKDKAFWGPKIGYYKLYTLGSPFITELIYKGFNEVDNPFIKLLKEILPGMEIPEDKYRVIHNMYVDGYITDDDLKNANASKVAKYLRMKTLYKQTPDAMEEVIKKASPNKNVFKDLKRGRTPWRTLFPSFGINRDNYRLLMSIINYEFSESADEEERTARKYGLAGFTKADYDKWARQIAKTDIGKDNYRDVLEYLNRNFAPRD